MNTTASAASESPRGKGHSPAEIVARSGLPPQLGELVLAVTGKCRLWKSERTDVARELCAHFRDGLEAGATPDSLAASFGDPRRTAKLITVSRKRLRPLWWRTLRNATRGTGLLLALILLAYLALAARLMLGRPNIARNMIQELNAPILATSEADRAWPLYIQSRLEFGKLPAFMLNSADPDPRRPGDPEWPNMVAWLDAHDAALRTLRLAAAKPVSGYVLKSTMDPDLARAMQLTEPNYTYDPAGDTAPQNPMLVGVLLPQLAEMRKFARWLAADANLAASRGDADRYLADIRALFGLAEHAHQDRFLISDLVSLAIAELTLQTVTETALTPRLLNDGHLRDLAHELAAFAGGRFELSTQSESLHVQDLLQRFYTDDGKGDGYFVGGSCTPELYAEWGVPMPKAMALMRLMRPVQSVALPSRAEVIDLMKRFEAAAAADDALPPWRHAERTSDDAYVKMMKAGIYTAVPFLRSLQGSLDRAPMQSSFATRDRVETLRAAAMTVLAIESSRRATGKWPTSLKELTPSYLPRVPLDPFTGAPLRYLAPSASNGEPGDGGSAAQPVLYSVGANLIDDGGLVTTTKGERWSVSRFRQLLSDESEAAAAAAAARVKGDWVLWPVPPQIK